MDKSLYIGYTRMLEYKDGEVYRLFMEESAKIHAPRVLQIGTHRADPDVSTRLDHWVPHAKEHVGFDIEAGEDVDVVGDVHRLHNYFKCHFDIIIAHSVLEHFRMPWVVATQFRIVLRTGGLLYVQTHQTFPIHGYPDDYYRFSREALEDLFGPYNLYKVLLSDYCYPCGIIPPEGFPVWNPAAQSYLNVNILSRAL